MVEEIIEVPKAERKRNCCGIRSCGYWKGYPCGAIAIYKHGERHFCGSHLFVAIKTTPPHQEGI